MQRCLDLQQDQIVLKEKNWCNVSLKEIFSQVASEISKRWSNSNSEFKEPIVSGPKSIEQRLSRSWDACNDIARGKANLNIKEQWQPKLDKLFDIAYCKCRIVVCGTEVQCLCKCPLQLRLPPKELLWTKAQRERDGTVSSIQESQLDAEETARLKKKNLRESTTQASLNRQHEEALNSTGTFANDLKDDMIEIDDCNEEKVVSDGDGESISEKSYLYRNYLDIRCASVASITFSVSSPATAAIINGLLSDLIKAGHLSEDKKHLICDTNKVFRAKDNAMRHSRAEENYPVAPTSI